MTLDDVMAGLRSRLAGEDDDDDDAGDLDEIVLTELVELGEGAAVVYLVDGSDDPRSHEFRRGARIYVTPGAVVILSESIAVTDDRQIEG